MNRQEQMDMLKQEYQQVEVPEEALIQITGRYSQGKAGTICKETCERQTPGAMGSRSSLY